MLFISLTILGFIGMEIFSYLVHRFLFHGILWKIHVSHHKPNHGFFEPNDIFSLLFALIAGGLMIFGNTSAFAVGLGITIYGVIYFITHDLFTHRRFLPFNSKNKMLRLIRAAHQRHHQTTEKIGFEPFGLFLFNFPKFWKKISS